MQGADLAARIRADVAREAEELGGACLATTVLVGDDPASHVYVGKKHEAAEEAGIDSRRSPAAASTSEDEVLDLLDELNDDGGVDGILVQLPLPPGMDEARVTQSVLPVKDVDGFHPVNQGHLLLDTPLHVPATAAGCMELSASTACHSRAATPSWSAAARSSASRWRCCSSRRTRR